LEPYLLLMILQILMQVACIFKARQIASESASSPSTAYIPTLVFSYCSFWGVISAQTFEFHPVALGMSLAFLGLLENIRASKKAIFYWILTIFCGEMFLIVAPTGIAITLLLKSHLKLRDKIVIQALCFALGAVLFLAYLTKFAPSFRSDNLQSSLLGRYAHLGETHVKIIKNIIFAPNLIWHTIFTSKKILFLAKIAIFFVPLVLLIFSSRQMRRCMHKNKTTDDLKLPILLLTGGVTALAGPLAKILLSNSDTYLATKHHYLADIMPSLCLVFISFAVLSFKGIAQTQVTATIDSTQNTIRYSIFGLITLAINFQISDFKPLDSLKSFSIDYDKMIPARSFKQLCNLGREFSLYSDTFGLAHILSSRRNFYSEFTHRNVYTKNGYPDLLVLVFPIPDKAEGGYALRGQLETRGTRFIFVQNSEIKYEMTAKIAGQTENGISIYRKRD